METPPPQEDDATVVEQDKTSKNEEPTALSETLSIQVKDETRHNCESLPSKSEFQTQQSSSTTTHVGRSSGPSISSMPPTASNAVAKEAKIPGKPTSQQTSAPSAQAAVVSKGPTEHSKQPVQTPLQLQQPLHQTTLQPQATQPQQQPLQQQQTSNATMINNKKRKLSSITASSAGAATTVSTASSSILKNSNCNSNITGSGGNNTMLSNSTTSGRTGPATPPIVEYPIVEQTVKDLFGLFQTYGPLTYQQLEYNLPPLGGSGRLNQRSLFDILELLVAIGLVQKVKDDATPDSGTRVSATRYCMLQGIPRADVVHPKTILDQIEAAHDEIKRSLERTKRLEAVLMGSSKTAHRDVLKALVADFPEVLLDPVYFAALRNLHVDVGGPERERKVKVSPTAASALKSPTSVANKRTGEVSGARQANKADASLTTTSAVSATPKSAPLTAMSKATSTTATSTTATSTTATSTTATSTTATSTTATSTTATSKATATTSAPVLSDVHEINVETAPTVAEKVDTCESIVPATAESTSKTMDSNPSDPTIEKVAGVSAEETEQKPLVSLPSSDPKLSTPTNKLPTILPSSSTNEPNIEKALDAGTESIAGDEKTK